MIQFLNIIDHSGERHFVNPMHVIEVRKEASITSNQKKDPKAVFILDGVEPILSSISWEDWCTQNDQMHEQMQQQIRRQNSGIVTPQMGRP